MTDPMAPNWWEPAYDAAIVDYSNGDSFIAIVVAQWLWNAGYSIASYGGPTKKQLAQAVRSGADRFIIIRDNECFVESAAISAKPLHRQT